MSESNFISVFRDLRYVKKLTPREMDCYKIISDRLAIPVDDDQVLSKFEDVLMNLPKNKTEFIRQDNITVDVIDKIIKSDNVYFGTDVVDNENFAPGIYCTDDDDSNHIQIVEEIIPEKCVNVAYDSTCYTSIKQLVSKIESMKGVSSIKDTKCVEISQIFNTGLHMSIVDPFEVIEINRYLCNIDNILSGDDMIFILKTQRKDNSHVDKIFFHIIRQYVYTYDDQNFLFTRRKLVNK